MQSLCDLAQPRKLHWKVNKDVRYEIAQVAESLDRWRHRSTISSLFKICRLHLIENVSDIGLVVLKQTLLTQ